MKSCLNWKKCSKRWRGKLPRAIFLFRMKMQRLKKIAAFGLYLWAAAAVQGDILNENMKSNDSIGLIKALETKDGLSAQFWMTTSEQIFTAWSKTTAIRDLRPVAEIKRNVPVYVAVFIANPGVRRIVKANNKIRLTPRSKRRLGEDNPPRQNSSIWPEIEPLSTSRRLIPWGITPSSSSSTITSEKWT
jgi:hypothetical protein